MLEEILIRMLDLQGYCLEKAELRDDGLHLWCRLEEKSFVCPDCGDRVFGTHSHWEVTLRERPILGQPTFLHLPQYRVRCPCRNRPVTVELPVKESGFLVTHWLAVAVVEAAREVPVKFVARLFGMSWNTVRDIDLAYLKRKIETRERVAPNAIGVDEVSYQAGHKYLTIVTEPARRRILHVVFGRRAENFKEFFEDRMDPMACKWLEAACTDMWDPYVTTVRKYAPQAVLVYDPFHVSTHLHRAVDLVRAAEQTKLTQEGKTFLKRKRFLLLRGQEKLRPEQQQTLRQILEQNQNLHSAYLLKEQFRQLYDLDPEDGEPPEALYQRAFQFLVGWMRRALDSRLQPFRHFVNQLKRRWQGVLNYYRYPLTNGLSEGLNNKIASLKKRAYGYRNLEYFTLKIYQQGGFL